MNSCISTAGFAFTVQETKQTCFSLYCCTQKLCVGEHLHLLCLYWRKQTAMLLQVYGHAGGQRGEFNPNTVFINLFFREQSHSKYTLNTLLLSGSLWFLFRLQHLLKKDRYNKTDTGILKRNNSNILTKCEMCGHGGDLVGQWCKVHTM